MKTRNHSIELPAAIGDYWAAANTGAAGDAATCFTADAVVQDEGRRHAGRAEIAAWVAETTRQYHPVTEALRIEECGGRQVVTARVSGTFPGSPVDLEFEFMLKDGKIVRLEVK